MRKVRWNDGLGLSEINEGVQGAILPGSTQTERSHLVTEAHEKNLRDGE